MSGMLTNVMGRQASVIMALPTHIAFGSGSYD